jgi:hypothetical protein
MRPQRSARCSITPFGGKRLPLLPLITAVFMTAITQ